MILEPADKPFRGVDFQDTVLRNFSLGSLVLRQIRDHLEKAANDAAMRDADGWTLE